MEVAFIPPIAHLDFTHRTGMQLMLPQLLGDSEYRDVYEDHLSNPNMYVILDNGAAEGEQPNPDELVAIVEDLYPQELAIPDVLGDSGATADNALQFLSEYHEVFEDSPTRLGLVTQGTGAFEATHMVRTVMESPYADLIEVFYIPRLLIPESGDKLIRIKLANHFRRFQPTREIHLFGAHPAFPNEPDLAKLAGSIRSIDTSLPFSAACYNQSLRLKGVEAPGRPQDYFYSQFDPEQEALADDNAACYLEWATND